MAWPESGKSPTDFQRAEGQAKFRRHKPGESIDAGILTEVDKSGYIDRPYADAKAR